MKAIKTGYAYLFFFFYNSVNKVKGNIFVQFKALLMIAVLEMLLLASIFYYGVDIYKFDILESFSKLYFLIPILPIVGLKLWFFERKENWKKYINDFETWSEEKRKKWDWIMKILIAFIIGNLICSFYIMSQIDWSK